jgi:phosphoribosylformimino-5-aminoimidazole carboxamide ribotide isomerase
VRDEATAARLLEAGAERVVVGTAAVRDPELVATLVRRYGQEAVVVALDALDGEVRVDGWTEERRGRAGAGRADAEGWG